MTGRRASRLATAASPPIAWRRDRDALVDRLEPVGDVAPSQLFAQGRGGLAQPVAQRRVLDQAPQLPAHSVGVVGGVEQQPALALREHLLVDRQRRCQRHGARAERAQQRRRRRPRAVGAGDGHLCAGERIAALDEADVLAQAGAQRRRARRPASAADDHLELRIVVEPAQRAQEQPQRAAFLVVGEPDPQQPVRRRLCGDVGARPDDLVVGRERAREQIARRLEAREPCVEPPEDELHELASDLRRDQPLGGRMERPDVERPRLAQGDARHARRPGFVHVADVERGLCDQLLDGARHVDRQRRA